MHLVKTCRNVPSISAKNIPMFPIENQQISRKKNSHYINIKVTNQNIRYLLEVLHFATRFCQALMKLQETYLFKLKLKSKLLKMDDKVKYI